MGMKSYCRSRDGIEIQVKSGVADAWRAEAGLNPSTPKSQHGVAMRSYIQLVPTCPISNTDLMVPVKSRKI